jgi:RNA polymerase sigma-70 factor (ECF subfamily)
MGSVELAENVASETLVKLLQYPRPAEIENFESWLFAVAKNVCLTQISTSKRRDQLLNENLEIRSVQSPEVEQNFSLENINQIIKENLDEKDHKIWQLHQQGYDNAEIAEIIGSTEKTVANRKSAARIKLKTALKLINDRY